nr:MAG TPA: hypothetical protein [Caudoviricetes sp.]
MTCWRLVLLTWQHAPVMASLAPPGTVKTVFAPMFSPTTTKLVVGRRVITYLNAR